MALIYNLLLLILIYFKCIKLRVKSYNICRIKPLPNTVSKGRVNNIKGVILYNRVKAMQPLTVRHMSSFIDQDRANFLEWFRGFTDAEGCFTIGAVGNSHYFQFSFTIGLHIDDIEVLEYIQKTLGMGNIHISGVWRFEELDGKRIL